MALTGTVSQREKSWGMGYYKKTPDKIGVVCISRKNYAKFITEPPFLCGSLWFFQMDASAHEKATIFIIGASTSSIGCTCRLARRVQ
jgi:hypothetical protein